MRSDKLSFYRCYGLFHAESITLKSKHGIKVLNGTAFKSLLKSIRQQEDFFRLR